MPSGFPPYLVLNKKRGETPLECIDAWRAEDPSRTHVAAAYAGRLDPMASGKLLVLLADECRRQERYFGLDKEYEIEVVLDIGTDTGDTLGLPTSSSKTTLPSPGALASILRKLSGSHTVPYPHFSSKTVAGKPLFMYTLDDTISSIEVPTHTETIYRMQHRATECITQKELLERVKSALLVVPKSDQLSKLRGADFRQDTIRTEWDTLLSSMPDRTFTVLSLSVTCASGTYMRTLAKRIAEELETTGYALSINRTAIGRYRTLGPFGFWTKRY